MDVYVQCAQVGRNSRRAKWILCNIIVMYQKTQIVLILSSTDTMIVNLKCNIKRFTHSILALNMHIFEILVHSVHSVCCTTSSIHITLSEQWHYDERCSLLARKLRPTEASILWSRHRDTPLNRKRHL